MVDWQNELRPGQTGLVVEGKDDRKIIESFLNAWMKADSSRPDWTGKIQIFETDGLSGVQRELRKVRNSSLNVWGLIDHDWFRDDELREFQKELPQLLILPRVTIENYLIDPDELKRLLTTSKLTPERETDLRSRVEAALSGWIMHGALRKTLHDSGADYFCRGSEGFPIALTNVDEPITDDNEIIRRLDRWVSQLHPQTIMPLYHQRRAEFETFPQIDQYRACVDGKRFFNRVVCPTLSRIFGQRSRDDWLGDLLALESYCPDEIEQLLQPLLI